MNNAAFTHKPKHLHGVHMNPVHTKALWTKVWDAARAQDWYSDDLGYVGNENGYFYFQRPGLTTGFARVQVEA